MSSMSRSKNKLRLSEAMDTNPREIEEPPKDVSQVDSAPVTAQKATPKRRAKQPFKQEQAAPSPSADPAIQEINGRVYVQVGDDLMPEGARVQMTVALTAIERHKWLQYAKQNDLTIVEVLRRAMNQLID